MLRPQRRSTSSGTSGPVIDRRIPISIKKRGRTPSAAICSSTGDGSFISRAISPVEPSHALESMTVGINRSYPEEIGSEGVLKAQYVESRLTGKQLDKGAHSIPVGIRARYVELGKVRENQGTYVLRYRVEGGGLLGGRSLRLSGLSR